MIKKQNQVGRPPMDDIDKRKNCFNIKLSIEEKLLISENLKRYALANVIDPNNFSISEYIRIVMNTTTVNKLAPLIASELRGARKESDSFYVNAAEWEKFNKLVETYCSQIEKTSKNELLIKLALTRI